MRHDDVRVIQVYVVGRPDAGGDFPSPLHRAPKPRSDAAARAAASCTSGLAAPRQTTTLAGISPRASIAHPRRGTIAQLEASPRQRCGSVVHCTALHRDGAAARSPSIPVSGSSDKYRSCSAQAADLSLVPSGHPAEAGDKGGIGGTLKPRLTKVHHQAPALKQWLTSSSRLPDRVSEVIVANSQMSF